MRWLRQDMRAGSPERQDPQSRDGARTRLAASAWSNVRLLIIVLAFVVLGSSACFGQHFTFAQFGQVEGLLNLDANSIVQDPSGVVWVGTENGVFRADGSHFVKVPGYTDAEQGSVLAMHVDGAGRVWVAGANQLIYLTADLRLHVVARVEQGVLLARGIQVTSLPEEPDRVFLLLNGRLEQMQTSDRGVEWTRREVFDSKAVEAKPFLRRLSSLVADPARNTIWAGCDGALCQFQFPAAGSVNAAPSVVAWGSERGVPGKTWSSLLVARDGTLWAAGPGELVQLNPRSWAVRRLGNPGGPGPAVRASRLAEDRDGNILATLPVGLSRLRAGRWERWTSENGLPSSQIVSLFFDKLGGFWLAPVGGGVWRWLGYGNWQAWTHAEGLQGDVSWAMLRDRQGRLWATSLENLFKLDEAHARMEPLRGVPALADLSTLAIDDRGHVWGGTSEGILEDYDPESGRARQASNALGAIYRLRTDATTGRIWVCTTKGVFFLSGEDGWHDPHPVEDLEAPHANVWGVTQDREGSMWFTSKGNLYRFRRGTWTHIALPDEAAGVEYPTIGAAPDGSLWMQAANPHPLVRLVVTGREARVAGFVKDDVIGSDDVAIIRFDSRGWLWVGTDIGLYVFDGARWVHCTQEDGLISDDLDTAAVFEERDGSMWFGTVGGWSHLLHPEELFQVSAPRMSVREIRLNGTRLQPGANGRFDIREPALAPDLSATHYKRPRAVVFRYKLRGLDDNWQSSASGSLRFTSLPPGDYTLTVQAMDTRVHAFSPPVDYGFEVLPPWYRRDRAKLAALGLSLLAGALWWKMSLSRLQRSEALLKRKVDQQTAELRAEKEQLQRAQRELVESSRRDSLTGLLNRSAIFEVLSRMRRRSLENGTPLCVVMADLDHFKSINDRWGHAMGDAVLRECAERLQETLRPDDFVGRYGGEEVLLVIPGLRRDQAATRLEEVREAIASRPVVHGTCSVQVTSSFGVAWLSECNREIESVVNDADAALYMAKQNGRNRVEFAPELDDAAYTQSHLFELGEAGSGAFRAFPAAGVERG